MLGIIFGCSLISFTKAGSVTQTRAGPVGPPCPPPKAQVTGGRQWLPGFYMASRIQTQGLILLLQGRCFNTNLSAQ